jgi:hypothetical protein
MAVVFLIVSSPVFAHHGGSAYDHTTVITVRGTVVDFQFVNPHVQIYFDAKDDKGNVIKWQAESNSPNTLTRMGWSKNILKPGAQITVSGYRAKNGSPLMHVVKIVLSNGTELDVEA